ncbi:MULTISPECIES: hypothetical protein [Candidatus Avelusimicrobium]|uniref:hypothetical protein n=1 Tax=Candidatus Avelusimicrobium TaxID=2840538 RepID=UPI003D12CC63
MSNPKFKVGDIVFGRPVFAVWSGRIEEVVPAKKTERKIPGYIVAFANWGKCARYEDEIFATGEEALEAHN